MFVCLVFLGNNTIEQTINSIEYSNIELISSSIKQHESKSDNTVSCSQCHGCKSNTYFNNENDSLNLFIENEAKLDTIQKIKKDVELKLKNKL